MKNEKLIELYKNGNKELLNILYENNQGLINKCSNRYFKMNKDRYEYDDIFQIASMGFLKAVDTYNINRACFSTWAIRVMCQYISNTIYKAKNYIINKSTISINTIIEDTDGCEFESCLPDENVNIESDTCEYEYLRYIRDALNEAMDDCLSNNEKEIIQKKVGWNNNKPISCSDISSLYNISVVKVQRMYKSSLNKLRKNKFLAPLSIEYEKDLEDNKYDSYSEYEQYEQYKQYCY